MSLRSPPEKQQTLLTFANYHLEAQSSSRLAHLSELNPERLRVIIHSLCVGRDFQAVPPVADGSSPVDFFDRLIGFCEDKLRVRFYTRYVNGSAFFSSDLQTRSGCIVSILESLIDRLHILPLSAASGASAYLEILAWMNSLLAQPRSSPSGISSSFHVGPFERCRNFAQWKTGLPLFRLFVSIACESGAPGAVSALSDMSSSVDASPSELLRLTTTQLRLLGYVPMLFTSDIALPIFLQPDKTSIGLYLAFIRDAHSNPNFVPSGRVADPKSSSGSPTSHTPTPTPTTTPIRPRLRIVRRKSPPKREAVTPPMDLPAPPTPTPETGEETGQFSAAADPARAMVRRLRKRDRGRGRGRGRGPRIRRARRKGTPKNEVLMQVASPPTPLPGQARPLFPAEEEEQEGTEADDDAEGEGEGEGKEREGSVAKKLFQSPTKRTGFTGGGMKAMFRKKAAPAPPPSVPSSAPATTATAPAPEDLFQDDVDDVFGVSKMKMPAKSTKIPVANVDVHSGELFQLSDDDEFPSEISSTRKQRDLSSSNSSSSLFDDAIDFEAALAPFGGATGTGTGTETGEDGGVGSSEGNIPFGGKTGIEDVDSLLAGVDEMLGADFSWLAPTSTPPSTPTDFDINLDTVGTVDPELTDTDTGTGLGLETETETEPETETETETEPETETEIETEPETETESDVFVVEQDDVELPPELPQSLQITIVDEFSDDEGDVLKLDTEFETTETQTEQPEESIFVAEPEKPEESEESIFVAETEKPEESQESIFVVEEDIFVAEEDDVFVAEEEPLFVAETESDVSESVPLFQISDEAEEEDEGELEPELSLEMEESVEEPGEESIPIGDANVSSVEVEPTTSTAHLPSASTATPRDALDDEDEDIFSLDVFDHIDVDVDFDDILPEADVETTPHASKTKPSESEVEVAESDASTSVVDPGPGPEAKVEPEADSEERIELHRRRDAAVRSKRDLSGELSSIRLQIDALRDREAGLKGTSSDLLGVFRGHESNVSLKRKETQAVKTRSLSAFASLEAKLKAESTGYGDRIVALRSELDRVSREIADEKRSSLRAPDPRILSLEEELASVRSSIAEDSIRLSQLLERDTRTQASVDALRSDLSEKEKSWREELDLLKAKSQPDSGSKNLSELIQGKQAMVDHLRRVLSSLKSYQQQSETVVSMLGARTGEADPFDFDDSERESLGLRIATLEKEHSDVQQEWIEEHHRLVGRLLSVQAGTRSPPGVEDRKRKLAEISAEFNEFVLKSSSKSGSLLVPVIVAVLGGLLMAFVLFFRKY